MRKFPWSKKHAAISAGAVLVIGLLLAWSIGSLSAHSAAPDTISPEKAVPTAFAFASASAQGGIGFAGLIGAPTDVRGDVVSLDTAVRIQSGHGIDPNSSEWLARDQLVWLVVFEGDVDAKGEGSLASNVTEGMVYSQVTIIMDSKSGQLISRSAHPSGQERDVRALDDLGAFLP